MLVAVEVDTLDKKLSMVKTKALVHTLANRAKDVGTMLHTCQGRRRDAYIRTD